MIVEEVRGEYGRCLICDNTDKEFGLTTVTNNFDLCITDPPYNCDYDGKIQGTCNNKDKHWYEDNIKDYPAWILNWFPEIRKISKTQLVWPGNMNIGHWYDYEHPVSWQIHHKPNTQGRTSLFHKENGDMILMYGKFRHQLDYKGRVNTIPLNKNSNKEYTHGCPKDPEIYRDLIVRSKATSCIDPFMGTGTLALICEELGIRWFGYERDPEAIEDIEKSIRWGQEARKNNTIDPSDW